MADTERSGLVPGRGRDLVEATTIRWRILKAHIRAVVRAALAVEATTIRWRILKDRHAAPGRRAHVVEATTIRWRILKVWPSPDAFRARAWLKQRRSDGGY